MFFGVELHDSEAELGVIATGQGDGGGRGALQRRHRLIWAAVRERESRGARGEREPESERASGSRGVAEEVQGDEGGQQEVEAGGGARARARRHASAYWQRWKKTKAPLVGWADSAGPPGGWASGKRRVSFLCSVFYLLFSIFFCSFVALLKILNQSQKSCNCS